MRYPMALAVLGIAACAEEEYQRPRTVEYITEAILIPSCAAAQCHSDFKQAEGLSFTTVDVARQGIIDMVSGSLTTSGQDVIGIPENAQFFQVLVRTVDRMPYDQPLANADIDLIREFIEIGAPHAQCRPSDGELQCLGEKVYTCNAEFNFGELVQDCAQLQPGVGFEYRCLSGACVEVAL
ncbi:MAG: hypothetical protein SFX73_19740 [Kofleriaceae bacterium]|nr:hypothetical protein [Kofleriaceae bacterium]